MLNDLHTVGTVPLLGLAVVATLAILAAGTRLTGTADVLADRTGLGEALVGGVLLGASTSLSGTVTSVSAAWLGHPDLAFSNAIGGIAVQTTFIALADLVYRRATLAFLVSLMAGALRLPAEEIAANTDTLGPVSVGGLLAAILVGGALVLVLDRYTASMEY